MTVMSLFGSVSRPSVLFSSLADFLVLCCFTEAPNIDQQKQTVEQIGKTETLTCSFISSPTDTWQTSNYIYGKGPSPEVVTFVQFLYRKLTGFCYRAFKTDMCK